MDIQPSQSWFKTGLPDLTTLIMTERQKKRMVFLLQVISDYPLTNPFKPSIDNGDPLLGFPWNMRLSQDIVWWVAGLWRGGQARDAQCSLASGVVQMNCTWRHDDKWRFPRMRAFMNHAAFGEPPLQEPPKWVLESVLQKWCGSNLQHVATNYSSTAILVVGIPKYAWHQIHVDDIGASMVATLNILEVWQNLHGEM